MHRPDPVAFLRSKGTCILLAAAALLTAGGCGGGGSDLTDPTPGPIPDPSDPSDPIPPVVQPPVGPRIWAVDLANNLLLFGADDPTVLSLKRPISGVPILKRIIGIAFRPSDGRLYGVGNDSRVYVIDTVTAAATPVGSQTFSPDIIEFFDIHFAMALEPGGNRVRLIAAESGTNWSISLDDGSATTGAAARYADSTEFAGQTPRLMGIAFAPPQAPSIRPAWSRLDPEQDCENLMYAIDADRAKLIGSCDPDSGLYQPFEDIPDEAYARCGEVMFGPGAGIGQGDADHPFPPPAGLWVLAMRGTAYLNSLGTVNPDGSITWHGEVPSESPIQSAVFAEGGLYGPRPGLRPASLRAAPRHAAAPSSAGDPRVTCPGA